MVGRAILSASMDPNGAVSSQCLSSRTPLLTWWQDDLDALKIHARQIHVRIGNRTDAVDGYGMDLAPGEFNEHNFATRVEAERVLIARYKADLLAVQASVLKVRVHLSVSFEVVSCVVANIHQPSQVVIPPRYIGVHEVEPFVAGRPTGRDAMAALR